MKPISYMLVILGIVLVVACASERQLPPVDSPIDVLVPPEPIPSTPLAPPMDIGVQKRSRLPTPKRIQFGEVVIDDQMAIRAKCDRIPGEPSAAHPTIKCGTRIHVVDVETNKEIWVVVTHRLSLEGDRILYLAPRKGKELGIEKVKGAQAKMEIVEKGMNHNAARPSPKDFKKPMVNR